MQYISIMYIMYCNNIVIYIILIFINIYSLKTQMLFLGASVHPFFVIYFF